MLHTSALAHPVLALLAILFAALAFGLTIQILYAASTTITITLASLANSSYRQSAVVDNSTNLYTDALVSFKFKTAASAAGTVSVYVYATADGGSTYSDGASGSDASFSPTNSGANLKAIGTFTVGASQQYTGEGPYSIAALFGGTLPQKWGVVFFNGSGQALDSTAGNFSVSYTGVNTKA